MKLNRIKPIFWLLLFFSLYYLFTQNHYGFNWDEPGHLTDGITNLKKLFGQNIPWFRDAAPYGPFASTLGATSYFIFFVFLHLLPFDAAFNLPVVLLGILGIYMAYLFGKTFFSEKVGFFSALFLAISPRFVGHIHNNIKDIPSAVLISISFYFFAKLLYQPRVRIYLAAAVATGLAISQKINAMEIFPIVTILWLLKIILQKGQDFKQRLRDLLPLAVVFFLALIFGFLFWPRLWDNPLGEIPAIIKHFSMVWKGNSVPLFGKYYLAGIDVPPYYALAFFAITTPVYILFFAITGVLQVALNFFRKPQKFDKQILILLLLLAWFFVPTLKYFVPGIIVYDDVRQYIEAIFPLVIFAGIGVDWFINSIKKYKFVSIILLLLFVTHFAYVEKNYFPYETSYFNVLVGGLKGADKQLFDPDFYGNSEKEATAWLNKVAPLKSTISIPLNPDVAAFYLRPDLKLFNFYDDIFKADYVMIVNRPSVYWLNRGIYSIFYKKPVYTIQRDNTILLFIYKK